MNADDSETTAAGRRALGARGWDLLSAHQGAIAALSHLCLTHSQLWDLEDRARSRLASDSEIAAIKRAIDRTNAERHRQVDALDGQLIWPTPEQPAPRLFSETPGELCDRLVIIELKVRHLELLVHDPSLTGAECDHCGASLVRQQRWQTHLQNCFVEQVIEQAAGRGSAPPRAEIKLYNDRRLNSVTRREDSAY